MTAKHNKTHVTPPNRNKKSTQKVVQEAQKEYLEKSRNEKEGTTTRVRPGGTFKAKPIKAPDGGRPSQGD